MEKEATTTATKIEKSKTRLHYVSDRRVLAPPSKTARFFFPFFRLKLVDGLIKHVEDANTGLNLLLLVANINLSCENDDSMTFTGRNLTLKKVVRLF